MQATPVIRYSLSSTLSKNGKIMSPKTLFPSKDQALPSKPIFSTPMTYKLLNSIVVGTSNTDLDDTHPNLTTEDLENLKKSETKHFVVNNTRISLCLHDLRKEATDLVVNAANSALGHGGGLARALSIAGGPTVNAESKKYIEEYGEIRTGETCYTTAGKMKNGLLLHTVGPRWYDFKEGEQKDARTLLKECATSIWTLSNRLGAGSVSIPPISSGLFGYPKKMCAEDLLTQFVSLARKEVKITDGQGKEVPQTLDYVRIVMFDQVTLDAFIPVFDEFKSKYDGIGPIET